MNVTLIITRFDPERDTEHHEQVFRLRAQPVERMLDLLERVRDTQDPTLAFRSGCGQGACGSDAMSINGRNQLACRVRVGDLKSREIHVGPLPGFHVLRDLVVDLEPFHDHNRRVWAALEEDGLAGSSEGLISPESTLLVDRLGSCLFCGACTSACPVFRLQPAYLGPAALIQAWPAMMLDERRGKVELVGLLDQWEGVWGCRSSAACNEACPQGIPITRLLAEIKRAL